MAQQCRPAISSHSLGRAWVHDLPGKLACAAAVGFAGIELFHEDLIYHAAALSKVAKPSESQQLTAATAIRELCEALHLPIVCLQPFRNFEGLRDPATRQAKFDEVEHWIALAHALGTGLIAIASNLLSPAETTAFPARLAADLAAIADAGAAAEPPIRFSYEALCFGTHVVSWQQSLSIVRGAGRSNLGICIDTFNLAGWAYADPTVAGGVRPDGAARLHASVHELVSEVDPAEIFYIQVVDAERLAAPLDARHPLYVEGNPARMSWSRACRLFYGETERGAYMPIREVMEALVQGLGWRGWVSMEMFNRSLEDPTATVPQEHAARGMKSWEKLVADFPEIKGALKPTRGLDGTEERTGLEEERKKEGRGARNQWRTRNGVNRRQMQALPSSSRL